MGPLDDIIRHGTEGPALDFKQEPYRTDEHEELLRDVLALANAHGVGDAPRYIVFGVKVFRNGHRKYFPVPDEAIADAADYQQLVSENIEPALEISYTPHEIDGKRVTVLSIAGCADRPYAMKKQYRATQHGLMWIRRGTFKAPITRPDLELIYEARSAARRFSGAVRITFPDPGAPTRLTLPAADPIKLPSDRAVTDIRAILAARAAAEAEAQAEAQERAAGEMLPGFMALDLSHLMKVPDLAHLIQAASIPRLGPRPYSEWDTDELERELRKIVSAYGEEDEDELFTRYAHRVNVLLRNDSTEHLENARLDITIANVPGVRVAEGAYHASVVDYRGVVVVPRTPTLRYPAVERQGGVTHVGVELGDLRHQYEQAAFAEPLRIVLAAAAIGQTVTLACELRGKHLVKPITATLTIMVGPADGTFPLPDPDADDEDG